MPVYPRPDENPACQCRGDPIHAFICQTGHMTECHTPYSCTEAGCSHLTKYDLYRNAFQLQIVAQERLENGLLSPYRIGGDGQVIVQVPNLGA